MKRIKVYKSNEMYGVCKVFSAFALLFVYISNAQVNSKTIDDIIKREMIRQEIPGIAVGVYKKGVITYTKGYGYKDLARKTPLTDRTILNWASISKTLTAVAALQLDERKPNFNITDKVVQHYPYWTSGLNDKDHHKNWKEIMTIEDLLRHKSGINHYGRDKNNKKVYSNKSYSQTSTNYNPKASVDIFKQTKLDFKPGSDKLYSTYGYSLLGATIDKISRGYTRWVKTYIKNKLGMHSLEITDKSTNGLEKVNGIWTPRAYSTAYKVLAGGGWQSDIRDLLKFSKGILDKKLLKDTRRLWRTGDWLIYQGLESKRTGTDFRVWHEGSHPNVKTIMYIMPNHDIAVVIMIPVGKTIKSQVVKPFEIVRPIVKLLGIKNRTVETKARNKCGKTSKNSDRKFAVVWRKSSKDAIIRRGYDYNGFYEQWKILTNAGYQCVDIETYKIGRTIKWDGIFKKQPGKSAMWRGFSQDAFKIKWQEMSKKGYRLIDIETYGSGSERKWAGIFVAGEGKYALFRNFSTKSFGEKRDALAKQGYKLIDIEAYEEGGKLQWAGVWREGIDGKLNRNYSHRDFEAKHRQWEKQGYRLVDWEPYNVKGKILWAGIWEKSNESQKINSNLGFCQILKKNELWEKSGHEMIDMEIY